MITVTRSRGGGGGSGSAGSEASPSSPRSKPAAILDKEQQEAMVDALEAEAERAAGLWRALFGGASILLGLYFLALAESVASAPPESTDIWTGVRASRQTRSHEKLLFSQAGTPPFFFFCVMTDGGDPGSSMASSPLAADAEVYGVPPAHRGGGSFSPPFTVPVPYRSVCSG